VGDYSERGVGGRHTLVGRSHYSRGYTFPDLLPHCSSYHRRVPIVEAGVDAVVLDFIRERIQAGIAMGHSWRAGTADGHLRYVRPNRCPDYRSNRFTSDAMRTWRRTTSSERPRALTFVRVRVAR
jgi:hypothetical protein